MKLKILFASVVYIEVEVITENNQKALCVFHQNTLTGKIVGDMVLMNETGIDKDKLLKVCEKAVYRQYRIHKSLDGLRNLSMNLESEGKNASSMVVLASTA